MIRIFEHIFKDKVSRREEQTDTHTRTPRPTLNFINTDDNFQDPGSWLNGNINYRIQLMCVRVPGCVGVYLCVGLSVCVFHSGDFIFKAIFIMFFFSSYRTSTKECLSQTRF